MNHEGWLVLVAAGRGERLGRSEPKALVALAGEPILRYALESAGQSQELHGIVVVGDVPLVQPAIARMSDAVRKKIRGIVPGGEARRDSVLAGLRAVESQDPNDPVVLVHDAARPFAPPELFDEIATAARSGAVICAQRIVDTVKEVNGERIINTLSRENLALAQTPQAARLSLLLRAHEESLERPAGDDSVLLESLGEPVRILQGPPTNFKITTPQDLRLAEAWVQVGGAEWMSKTSVGN